MYKQDYDWASEIAGKIYEKMKVSAARSEKKIPYLTIDGIFDDWSGRISWWTNGFYGGQLWQLYHAYGDEIFRRAAERIEGKLDGSLMDYLGMDHDSGDVKYLETAKKTAAYFASCIPESGLIPVDFCQDNELDWEDSTAAAIAACGMLEIERAVPDSDKPFFHKTAMRLLRALAEKRSNWDTHVDYILENGSVAYHDEKHNFPIIYGDYFFTEAVFKLCGKELFMW